MPDIISARGVDIFVATDGTFRFVCKCPCPSLTRPAGTLLCKAHAQEVAKRLADALNREGVINL